ADVAARGAGADRQHPDAVPGFRPVAEDRGHRRTLGRLPGHRAGVQVLQRAARGAEAREYPGASPPRGGGARGRGLPAARGGAEGKLHPPAAQPARRAPGAAAPRADLPAGPACGDVRRGAGRRADRRARPRRAHHRAGSRRPAAGRPPLPDRNGSAAAVRAGRADQEARSTRQPAGRVRPCCLLRGVPTLGHNSEPSSDRRASAFSTGSFAAVKWTGDNTDETTQIPIVVDSNSSSSAQNTAQSGASGAQAAANRGSEAAEPKATGRGHHEQREAAQAEPQKRAAQSAPRTEPAFRAYEPSPAATEQASESAKKQAAPQAEKQREDAAPEKGGAHEYRAGRRRADENSEGLTVAELMKRFQQNDKK